MKEKILISGSTGFIGSHLKESLNPQKYQVIGIGRGKNEDYRIDLQNDKAHEVIREINPHIVFHLASGSNIARAENEKENEYSNTVLSTQNLVTALRSLTNRPKLIYLSSQAVYGRPDFLPITESHPTKPVNIYGENKLKTEEVITSSGLDHLIFRVTSLYGQNQDYSKSGVFAKFLHNLKENKPPIVFNNLETISDLIYIKDLISAMLMAVFEHTLTGVYNLSSGIPTTLRELLDTLYKHFPDAPKPIIQENNIYSNSGLYLSSEKLQSQIPWSCKYNLEEGVNDLLYERTH